MRHFLLLLFFLAITFTGIGQDLFFKYDTSIPVKINEKTLVNPWTGGLNNVQISTVDIDNDQREDLFVFDRATGKTLTFLSSINNGTSYYKYEPKFEFLFPSFSGWVLFVDYNCDGKKDIFTSSSGGDVKVFKNVTPATGNILFTLIKEAVITEGLSGLLPLHISSGDIPSITDLDDDGDLDVLTFDASTGHMVQLHKNQSMEKYGICDSLDFKRIGSCWGNFMKGHSCTEMEFGVNCSSPEVMRVMHTGSTALSLDMDGDNIKDMLVGNVGCDNLSIVYNEGTSINGNFTSSDNFPNANDKVKMSFPAAFYEDVDFDGQKDIITSPNSVINEGNLESLDLSVWLYKNTSSAGAPVFEFVKKNFLQDEMIDLGEYSYPALIDIDGDGDLDLLVGIRGKIQSDNSFYATLNLFENTGNKDAASFALKNSDYLALSSFKYQNLKPQFIDLNNDSKLDLLYSATNPSTASASLFYILNTATTGVQFNLAQATKINFDFNDYDSPVLFDVNTDGILDLILGKSQGRLEYYINKGANLNPSFSLVNGKFGGIANSITDKNAFPVIANLNETGSNDLIVTDRNGNFKIFNKWLKEVDGTFTNSPEFLFDEFSEKFVLPRFGKEVFPTAGDLNNDGFPDLIIGTNGGGLVFLKNETRINGSDDDLVSGNFKIYPNPSNGIFYIESEVDGDFEVYSIHGQKIITGKVLANQKSELNLANFKKGVCIIRLKSNGRVLVKKIVND